MLYQVNFSVFDKHVYTELFSIFAREIINNIKI